MSEHHLTNARTVRQPNTIPPDTATPLCSQCATPLHLVPLEGIRTGTRTWCSDTCYKAYIAESAAQAVRDHVASPNYRPPRSRTLPYSDTPRPLTASQLEVRQRIDFHARQAGKSNTRKTAEAAANVVGFVIWLTIVSAIAAALFAACGINSMR